MRLSAAILTIALAPLAAGAQITQAEYAGRREALAALLGNGVLVALGSPEPEEDYISFFQNSHFRYLTGFNEPNATLVLDIRGGKLIGQHLFVQPSNPAREAWTGRRIGAAGVKQSMSLEGHPDSTFPRMLDSLLARSGATTLHIIGNYDPAHQVLTGDDQFVRAVVSKRPNLTVKSANLAVRQLRQAKSAAELDLIKKAVAISVDAHREAMHAMEPGQNEFETQALIEYTFRRNGAERPSFSTIIGSGPNSTTLHYNADDRFFGDNDVVVMDIGASYGGYSADVTRTIPVSGKYSADQRAVYQIVRDAQAAAERQAKLNGPARTLTDSAAATVAVGLAKLGLIERADATYDCDPRGLTQCSQMALFYYHGLGHGIGLDVHDPGAATSVGNLVAGSAFTIEPGIYVRENLLEIIPRTPRNLAMIQKIQPAVERYRNVGIRIEDDYIMTDRGLEWISRAPREIDEIEAVMREPWTGPSPRDKAKVDWYRLKASPLLNGERNN
jgi:Xaa-Pro aminopeptidase